MIRIVRDNPLCINSCGSPPSEFLKHGSGSTHGGWGGGRGGRGGGGSPYSALIQPSGLIQFFQGLFMVVAGKQFTCLLSLVVEIQPHKYAKRNDHFCSPNPTSTKLGQILRL